MKHTNILLDKSGISSLETLVSLRRPWRIEGVNVVLTNGVFDLLHYGHVEFLWEARALGDVLIVGVNDDDSVRTLNKGENRPIVPAMERATIVLALKPVDYVVIFKESTAHELLQTLQPDIYVKGDDYTLDFSSSPNLSKKPLMEAHVVYDYNGQVSLLPIKEGYSTSSIISQVIQAERKKLNQIAP